MSEELFVLSTEQNIESKMNSMNTSSILDPSDHTSSSKSNWAEVCSNSSQARAWTPISLGISSLGMSYKERNISHLASAH